MKIVEPKVTLLEQRCYDVNLTDKSTTEDISNIQNELFKGIIDHINTCSNFVYNVEDAKELVNGGKHLDILEHSTVYLTVPVGKPDPSNTEDYMRRMQIVNFYQNNPESVVKGYKSDEENVLYVYFITTNYRVIVENNRHADLIFLFNNSEYHSKRMTFMITTNRKTATKFNNIKYLNTSSSNVITDESTNELLLIGSLFNTNPEFKNKWIDICKETENLYKESISNGVDYDSIKEIFPEQSKVNIVISGFKEDIVNLLKTVEDDTDCSDIIHMIMYDINNVEVAEEIADEMVEENPTESGEDETSTTVEGNPDIPE